MTLFTSLPLFLLPVYLTTYCDKLYRHHMSQARISITRFQSIAEVRLLYSPEVEDRNNLASPGMVFPTCGASQTAPTLHYRDKPTSFDWAECLLRRNALSRRRSYASTLPSQASGVQKAGLMGWVAPELQARMYATRSKRPLFADTFPPKHTR
jgi:hypothetical protein